MILELHRLFIAISRAVVNHEDGDGTAPDPLIWSPGARYPRGVGLVGENEVVPCYLVLRLSLSGGRSGSMFPLLRLLLVSVAILSWSSGQIG